MSEQPPPPVIIECETCHLPVPVTDSICPHCGDLISDAALEKLR
jgi:hypothetical protein